MGNPFRLLLLNTGSTSTKVAYYHQREEIFSENIMYTAAWLERYPQVVDQLEARYADILACMKKKGIDFSDLDIVVSRGGSTKPVESGAYEVNDKMVWRLRDAPFVQHAGILGPVIAREIADKAGVKAYVYDSAATDELTDLARISGVEEIKRASLVHVLNTRYCAKKICEKRGICYEEANIIAAHIGGGITLSLHEKGKITDVVGDDEGSFSPDRAGGVPTRQLVDLCFNGTCKNVIEMQNLMRKRGGFLSYLGISDVREVERRIDQGGKKEKLILDAMVYQVSKSIASLAPVVYGKVDFILLTGGITRSVRITEAIRERILFLASVEVVPGEYEMEALCQGGIDILEQKIPVKKYVER